MKVKARNWFLNLNPAVQGILVAAIVLLLTVPWLGKTEFNTKGEPREAVVSLSMLQKGDWVLPVNNDVDIPYKPMMFHWLGSLTALANGGEVDEFTARFPSALAFALLIGSTWWFYARREEGLSPAVPPAGAGGGGGGAGALGAGTPGFGASGHGASGTARGGGLALPLLTCGMMFGCFELHRSGVNARVDMVLTAFMVLAIYLLFLWSERLLRRRNSFPWLAILCMSGATLTKGPVGIVLPCLIAGCYLLLKGYGLWSMVWRLAICTLLSLILPVLWYWLAYREGGQPFLDLVMEENFGRMTGTMSYDSHVNPWHYNFWITAVGFAPWTLLALFGAVQQLFSRCRRKVPKGEGKATGKASGNVQMSGNATVKSASSFNISRWRWKDGDLSLYSLLAICLVFLFYTLPSSKRSVYLMPAYPFIAWFAARYFIFLSAIGKRASIKLFNGLLSLVALVCAMLFLFIKVVPVWQLDFPGRKALVLEEMYSGLRDTGWFGWVIASLLAYVGAITVAWLFRSNGSVASNGRHESPYAGLWLSVGLCVALFLFYDSTVQPAVLNVKSLKEEAVALDAALGPEAQLYEYIPFAERQTANKYHFFELDFYLNDRVRNFSARKPESGYLAIPEPDAPQCIPMLEAEGYAFSQYALIAPPGRKEHILVYSFRQTTD